MTVTPELLADLRATAEAAASPTSTRAMRYAAEQRLGELLTPQVVLALLEPLPREPVAIKNAGDSVRDATDFLSEETLAEWHERVHGRPHPVLHMLRRKP